MEAYTQGLANLATFVFFASLKASMLVALVLLAQRLFGRFLSANGRYLLWLAVVISLVTPIGFDTTIPEFPAAETVTAGYEESSPEQNSVAQGNNAYSGAVVPDAGASSQNSVIATDVTGNTIGQAGNSFRVTDSFRARSLVETGMANLLQILPWLWLAGVCGVLGTLAYSSYRFFYLLRHSEPAQPYLQNILNNCMQKTGCRQKVKLLLSPKLQSPLIAGVFSPVLLWPEGLEHQLSKAQIEHVFIHELMHLKRLDIVGNCVTAILQALYWFNPVIWFAFACLRNDREMACDESTVKHLHSGDRHAYAHTLIHLGSTLPEKAFPATGLGILDTRSQLHQRILMLVRASLSHKIQLALTALLFMPLAVLAFSQPVPGSRENILPLEISGEPDVTPAVEQTIAEEAVHFPVALVEEQQTELSSEDEAGVTVFAASEAESATPQLSAKVSAKVSAEVSEAEVAEAEAGAAVPETETAAAILPPVSEPAEVSAIPDNSVLSADPWVQQEVFNTTEIVGSASESSLPEPGDYAVADETPAQRKLQFSRAELIDGAAGTSAQILAAVKGNEPLQVQADLPANSPSLQIPLKAAEPEERICRILSVPGSLGETRVCDTAKRWAEFDQSLVSGELTSAMDINADPEDYVIEIEYEVCRYRKRSDGRIQNKECRTPEVWAAYDRIRRDRTNELRQKVFESSQMTMGGFGSTPADLEAMSDRGGYK